MSGHLEFYAPYTGFGIDPDASVKFAIDVTRGMPDWSGGGAKLATLEPQNSSDVVVQYKGRKPRLLTLSVWFAHRDDLDAMDNLQGRKATLRYHANLTRRAGGEIEPIGPIPYLAYTDTLLLEVADQRTETDMTATATLTFLRAVNDLSYYGFAVYSEGE